MWVQSLGQKNPWSRKWQPTPVFLPGKLHGQRSPVGSSPWGCKRVSYDLVMKQQLYIYTQTHTHTHTHYDDSLVHAFMETEKSHNLPFVN